MSSISLMHADFTFAGSEVAKGRSMNCVIRNEIDDGIVNAF